jgi:hypothetical protein
MKDVIYLNSMNLLLSTKMFFNNDTMVVVIVILVLSLNTIIYFLINKNNIFTAVHIISNIVSNELRYNYLKLALGPITTAIVPYKKTTQTTSTTSTTEVELTDEELMELLEVVFNEVGNRNMISAEYLQSLGLYTQTVISYLEALGYIIF